MEIGNNMKNFYLLLFGCVLMLVGCKGGDEVFPNTKTAEYVVEFVNSSNHILNIGVYADQTYVFQNWDDERVATSKIVLIPDCRCFMALQKLGMWEDADYPPFNEVLGSAPVIYFDENIKMKFNETIDSPYNIGMSENFTQVVEPGKTVYRYEFTDADYDYAVEYGVKLGEKIE